ncbi:MAG: response regulator [Candidatus Promineifilaceae bacterium]|jgi:two-component system NtrC family sensor kinase
MTQAVSSNLLATRILVVDDEPEIAESLSGFLFRKEGYHVDVVSDGREAIHFLQETVGTDTEIDLVLLDMRMPGLSGLDVLDWIRNHPDLKYTRVVLLTAATGSQDKVEALSAGADDYITKPYYLQELLARVKTILRTQQLEKQLQRQSQQLATLNQVSKTVSATLDSSEVLSAAVHGVHDLFRIELAAVLLLESGKLHCQYLRDVENRYGPDLFPVMRPNKGIIGRAFQEQQSAFLNNPNNDPRFDPQSDIPRGIAVDSMIVTPLLVRGRPVGILTAYNKDDGVFTDVDLDLFASLGSSISEAIENSWLFNRIRLRQRELLESRNTLQALIDGIPQPIYTIDDNWHLVAINKSKADELSATRDSLVGQVCFKALYDRKRPCSHCLVVETLSHEQARTWTVRWLGEDHLPREWQINAYPIPGTQASSARAVLVWQDRTDERRLENSLMQAEKLAAIGQLAAGVAHELNNPLTAVNANAQMLKMVIPPSDENFESVDLIARAGDRAAKVVRGLLDFARKEHYSFVPGDVNESILGALDLIGYQLQSAGIEVIRHIDPDLPDIVASWEHLKSVWLNMLLNARDALQEISGERRIEIVTRRGNEPNQIQVLIHDNGKGISPAETAHIFEPFYTTKDPGKGTGLGLATCHRIIVQHGGEISVASLPGEGTTFVVLLAIIHQPQDGPKEEPEV